MTSTDTNAQRDLLTARIERLPVAWWHIRARMILGVATFFDAFDLLTISFVLPVLVGLWKLSPQEIGSIISAAFFGQIIGALVAGWAAERYGRLAVATVTVAVFSVMSFACAFAWDAQSLIIFRFIQGIGLGGEVPIATAYIIELARGQGRGRFYILYELVFAFGLVGAGLLGYWMVPTLGWQSMFYVGAIPALLALVLRQLLPESPRWLAQQGRLAEADAVVTQMERSVEASGHRLTAPVPAAVAPQREKTSWLEMFKGVYLSRTLSVWAMWFCCFSTTYGLNAWMPTLYRTNFNLPVTEALRYGLITQVCGIVGSILCAFSIDKIGRRPWFTLAMFAGGITLLLLAYFGPSTATLLLIFISVTTFFMSGVSIGLNLYTPEIYPTRIRAFASSIGGAWQRVAAASGPLVVSYLLINANLNAVFVYFGAVAVLGAVVAGFFTVETKNRALETLSP